MRSAQIRVGPELLSSSAEAWLAFYGFAALSLVVLIAGSLLLREPSGLSLEALVVLGLTLGLFLLCLGLAVLCHLLGHLIDDLTELRERPAPDSAPPSAPPPPPPTRP